MKEPPDPPELVKMGKGRPPCVPGITQKKEEGAEGPSQRLLEQALEDSEWVSLTKAQSCLCGSVTNPCLVKLFDCLQGLPVDTCLFIPPGRSKQLSLMIKKFSSHQSIAGAINTKGRG